MKKLRLFITVLVTIASLAVSATEPQGTPKYYTGTNVVYNISYNYSETNSCNVYAIFGDNNKVYLKGLIDDSNISDQRFIEGTLDGNKIRVQLPQVYYEKDENEYYYPTLLEKETYFGNMEGEYLDVDDEDNYVVYIIDDEGNITLDLNDDDSSQRPDYLLADASYYYGSEEYYTAIAAQSLTNLPQLTGITVNTIPDEVEMQEYKIVSHLPNYHTSYDDATLGILGDRVYINLIKSGWYDIVLTGDIDGNKVVLRAPQLVDLKDFLIFSIWGFTNMDYLDEVVYNFDPETRILTPADNIDVELNFYTLFDDLKKVYLTNPIFYPLDADVFNANPKDPSVLGFVHYGEEGPGSTGEIAWNIPDDNVNGYPIKGDRMYINLYRNGEIETFENYEDENITDIPFNYLCYPIIFFKAAMWMWIDDDDYTSFGLQTFYLGSDGVTYASNLVTYDPFTGKETGVQSVSSVKTLVDAEYYDLQGRRITDPAVGGIYIMRCTYSDGSTTTTKIAR